MTIVHDNTVGWHHFLSNMMLEMFGGNGMRDLSAQSLVPMVIKSRVDHLVIEPGTKVRWNGDETLLVENTITCQGTTWFEGSVTARRLLVMPRVEGEVGLHVAGHLVIEDDFHVKGDVTIEGTLEVNGDVIVFGTVRADSLKVGGKCHVSGSLHVRSIEIGDSLQVENQVTGMESFMVKGAVLGTEIRGFDSVIMEGRVRCEKISECREIDIYDDAKLETITACEKLTCDGRLDADVIENVTSVEIDDSLTVDTIQRVDKIITRSSMAVKRCLSDCNSVSITGSLRVDGIISQIGELTVGDAIRAEVIDSIKNIVCQGMLKVRELSDVQKIVVRDHLHAESINNVGSLEISGRLIAGSIHECQRIDVARSILLDNEMQARVIVTNGNLDVGSIHGCDHLLVSGEATIRFPCDVNEARIGKALTFAGGSIHKLEVGGRLINEGTLQADSILVGSLFKSIGKVIVQDELVVNGKARLDAPLKAKMVKIGSILDCQYLEAETVFVGRQVMIHEGLKTKEFTLGKEGRTMGPIIAEKARIQRNSIIDYLHAEHAIIERNVRARKIVINTGALHSHVEVSEELIHVAELPEIDRITCSRPPIKLEELPEPPKFSQHFN